MSKKPFYQINQYIKADKLRVVDEEGKQLGVLSKQQALDMARDKSLDLVEVAPNAKPPVAKIIDFKKFKYQQSKKEREARKKSGKVEQKEIRLTPFMAQGDLDNRIEKAREILEDGDRIKFVVKFVGRQITKKEFGYEILNRATDSLSDIASPDGEPKLQGKQLYQMVTPGKKQ